MNAFRIFPVGSPRRKQKGWFDALDCTESVHVCMFHLFIYTIYKGLENSFLEKICMQQAVTYNVMSSRSFRVKSTKSFECQDLGSLLTLGGPIAAIFAPRGDSPLAPLVASFAGHCPGIGLGLADEVIVQLFKSPVTEKASQCGCL